MRITLKCPVCDSALAIDPATVPAEVACGGCSEELALTLTDIVREDRAVDACPLCRGRDFYTRKDFDPKLGLTVVIVGALVSAGFYWFGLDLVAYGVLGAAALIDLVVYGRLKDLIVCYRCHSEFRGVSVDGVSGFDLATADELEAEWAREVEKRLKGGRQRQVGK